MKQLRIWLLPMLTCLVVLTVTLLPQHLSGLQDQKLMGHVHTEELTAGNNLPIQSPDLVQRMELLSRWMEGSDVLSAQQELPDGTIYDGLYAAVLEELQSFVDAGVLPLDLLPKEVPALNASRMHLQQLVGAEYYVVDTYLKTENINLWMVLDGETRQALWLELGHPLMEKYYQTLSPAELGVFFLERLDVASSLMTSGRFDAWFQVLEADLQYGASLDAYSLKISPMVIYPETDAESTSAAYGG